jgi:DNA-binding IclR family transcriptional regulator
MQSAREATRLEPTGGQTSGPMPGAANVRAVVRALTVLESFAVRPRQSLAEVTQATGLDKGTTRRLLLTLLHRGFVVQDPATQKYGLGRAIRTLAASVTDSIDFRAIASPILSELATELRLTAFLSIYHEHAAVCLERLHDVQGMEVRWWAIGGTLPLNCGGAPKVLLAFQSDDEIETALAGTLTKLTPKSITDPSELSKRLQLIRKRGWEFAIDDVAVGLTALALPILNEKGTPLCAISIGGLTPQMVERGRPVHLERMMAAARAIKVKLGVGEIASLPRAP